MTSPVVRRVLGRSTYDGVANQTVSVSTLDDGGVGFTIVEAGGSTSVMEGVGVATFTVALKSKPATDVVLTVTSSDTGEATADVSSLTFTTDNWNTKQAVKVRGVNDGVADGNQTATITLAVNDASSEDTYDALANQTVNVTVTESGLDLAVTLKTDGTTRLIGDILTYTTTAETVGSVNVTDTKLNIALVSDLIVLVQVATAGSYDAATGIWNIGTLQTNSGVTLTLTVNVSGDSANALVTTATFSGLGAEDRVSNNNKATVSLAVLALKEEEIIELDAPIEDFVFLVADDPTGTGTTLDDAGTLETVIDAIVDQPALIESLVIESAVQETLSALLSLFS